MVLEIIKDDDPIGHTLLHTPSVDVETFTPEIRNLCADMIDTMYAADGVGLAAPQIGKNINIFVMRTGRSRSDNLVLINPHPVIMTGGPEWEDEGCLSIPGTFRPVLRWTEVGVVFWTPTGERKQVVLNGFLARIFQHEYDHLQGILFPERATMGV